MKEIRLLEALPCNGQAVDSVTKRNREAINVSKKICLKRVFDVSQRFDRYFLDISPRIPLSGLPKNSMSMPQS